MMHGYRLTDDEYRTIMDALQYAEENAVHSDAQARFSNLQAELMGQWESNHA